uniref:Auxin efflux carrier component n=1 Tax=Oryza rufipogon TaxID=4529 RepID=A0A0E0QTG0_ORYRU
MAPLYFALGLGYGSVRWWRLFTADQCDAVNRLVACFAVPFFAFDFAARIDPFALSYRVLAADALSKLAVALALAACAAAASTRCCGSGGGKRGGGGGGGFSWCITGFSLATLNNTLVVGVPLLDAMYGKWARDLIVQISVVQTIVYFPLLLLAFEQRHADDERVVQRRQREPSDAPREPAAAAAAALASAGAAAAGGGGGGAGGEGERDGELGERVGGEDAVAEGEGVDAGGEVEGEEGDGEAGDEAVHGVALVGGEEAPPPHGAVAEAQREVERRHGRHYLVHVAPPDHLDWLSSS